MNGGILYDREWTLMNVNERLPLFHGPAWASTPVHSRSKDFSILASGRIELSIPR